MPDPSSIAETVRGKLVNLREWRDRELTRAIEDGEMLFMGFPSTWIEDPHWFCANGHVSGVYLKSEGEGNLCLACLTPVLLGPARIGEQYFRATIARMTTAELLAEEPKVKNE